MKIVVDTNILFSAIISQQSLFRKILFDDTLTLYAPNFAFVELFKYKEKIQKFCKLSDTELYEFMNLLVNRINFVNEQFISLQNRQKAYELCKEIDVKDTIFVALVFELNALLWTGDKKLTIGLQMQGFNNFFQPI